MRRQCFLCQMVPQQWHHAEQSLPKLTELASVGSVTLTEDPFLAEYSSPLDVIQKYRL